MRSASFRFRLLTALAIVIVAVPSLLVLQPPAVLAESFTLRVGSIEVSSGGDAEVPISVEGASDIGAMQFVLSYDSSLLTVTEVARGSLLGGDALLEFNADQPGRLAVAIVALENIQGDGPIALAPAFRWRARKALARRWSCPRPVPGRVRAGSRRWSTWRPVC